MQKKTLFLIIPLILSIGIVSTLPFSEVDAEPIQICIDKVWLESTKGKIACVTPSTADKLVVRGWGTLLDDSAELDKGHPEMDTSSLMKIKTMKDGYVYDQDVSSLVKIKNMKDGYVYDKDFSSLVKTTPNDDYVYDQDVSSLVKINTPNDVFDKRNLLIDFVWKEDGFPDSMPTTVEESISDERFENMKNLNRIDKLEIIMEQGVNSIVYHFVPEQAINKAIIYHQGHYGDFVIGKNTIQYFVENGYDVIAFAMPLLGMNNQPIIEHEKFGSIRLTAHQHLRFLQTEEFTPMKLFLEPLAVTLNYLEKEYNFESYYMIGISGGGLLTVLYPAIDDRISYGYSVAGSYPVFIESKEKRPWHYEYHLTEFYEISNYLELYVMAGYGDNRKLVQIFNEFDPCCYDGDYFIIYEDEIKNILEKLGKGKYDVHLDSTHIEHKISEPTLEIIQNFIEEKNS